MQVDVGEVYEGKVTGITNFGVFVALPEGKTGMVHISEVSNQYVKEIRDVLSENQEVKVKVIAINPDGKISLSIKQAVEPEPRNERPRNQRRPRRHDDVWQGNKSQQSNDNMSFEDMMAKFKQVSDEKMTDLKRAKEFKHGGFSRKGSRGNNNM